MTLKDYLVENILKDRIDHTLRAQLHPDGAVTFYIHPENCDGETRDFIVDGNKLAVNPHMPSLKDQYG